MRRSIERAAFNASAAQLFDPANRIIGQEGDLFSRMGAVVRICRRCTFRGHQRSSLPFGSVCCDIINLLTSGLMMAVGRIGSPRMTP